jgi:glycerol-3-phosphate acyltransferase PlsY
VELNEFCYLDYPSDISYFCSQLVESPEQLHQSLVFSLLIAGLLGYLIGSVPSAYLLVRWKSKVDIRSAGSGNVGTLNSYQVTRSKLVGASVLLLDLLKGIAAVIIAGMIFSDFAYCAVSGICAVLGHNFPVWLQFKGGRGLATAAGVMLSIGWVFVAIWCVCWFVGFKLSKEVNIGNAVACVGTLAFILLAGATVLVPLLPAETSVRDFRYFAFVLMTIILVKLIEPVREFVKSKKQNNDDSSRKL